MRQTKFPLFLATALFAFILPVLPQPALAVTLQTARTFVSATGTDNQVCTLFSPCCTFGAPCRSFQFAHDHTSPGGDIETLDAAGYGQLIITKAISIHGHGYAELGFSGNGSFNGITVNAGASDQVNLSGLILDGARVSGFFGILYNTGHSLTVTHCVVRRLAGDGIVFNALGQLVVSDTLVADNVGTAISISPGGSGPTLVAINRLQAYNNDAGIGVTAFGTDTVFVMITDSVIHGHTGQLGTGLMLFANGGGHATAHLLRSTISNNSVGIDVETDTTVRLGQSAMIGNGITGTGTLESFGDNAFDPNIFAVGSIPKK
jgi:hypothetical protein